MRKAEATCGHPWNLKKTINNTSRTRVHTAVCSVSIRRHGLMDPFSPRRRISHNGGKIFYHSHLRHYILRCLNCGNDTYLLHRPVYTHGESVFPGFESEILHAYPTATPLIHEAVPEAIQKAATEAERCFGVGTYNACGVMTRRAMHSLCKDKKAQGKDLFDQLNFLKDNHAITPDLWEWSEELRVLGKHGAHPEWEEFGDEDAEYGVRFLREIVRYVYILPFERSQKRLKENSQKA